MQTFDSDKEDTQLFGDIIAQQFEDLYRAARVTIEELQRQIASQRRHIEELEKQLEHVEPGLAQEVRQYLQSKEEVN